MKREMSLQCTVDVIAVCQCHCCVMYVIAVSVFHSSCHSEWRRRVGTPPNHTHSAPPRDGVGGELYTLSIEQMTELCEQSLHEVHHHCVALTHTMDSVLSRPPLTDAMQHTREVDTDFP